MIISKQSRQLLAAGGSIMIWNDDLSHEYWVGQPEFIEGIPLVVTAHAIAHVGGQDWQRVTVRAIEHAGGVA